MVDWTDGKPNPRLWVLELLHDNFGPGDKIVKSIPVSPYIYTLASVTKGGKHIILFVNKRDRDFEISIPGSANGRVDFVDVTTGFKPPASAKLTSDTLTLHGFSVAVLALP
jgi:hypothetical protein